MFGVVILPERKTATTHTRRCMHAYIHIHPLLLLFHWAVWAGSGECSCRCKSYEGGRLEECPVWIYFNLFNEFFVTSAKAILILKYCNADCAAFDVVGIPTSYCSRYLSCKLAIFCSMGATLAFGRWWEANIMASVGLLVPGGHNSMMTLSTGISDVELVVPVFVYSLCIEWGWFVLTMLASLNKRYVVFPFTDRI